MSQETDPQKPASPKTDWPVLEIKIAALAIGVVLCVLLGALLLSGAATAVNATNSIEFCTSCHEMADNNLAEYQTTIHARNRTGVKAVCSNCHVPHEFPDILIRKVTAVKDIYHHLAGTVDTKEKFAEHRLELAKTVWKRMEETDSRECRTCHDRSAMESEKQGKVAQKEHQHLDDGSATCIDCHYGIAHKLPKGNFDIDEIIAGFKKH